MDQGFIRSLKAHYQKNISWRIIRAVDARKPFPKTSILDAMQLLQSSWSQVLEATIKNCFRKAGISEKAAEEAVNDKDDPFRDLCTDDDMDLEETVEDLCARLPKMIPSELNAAHLLESDEELATSDSRPTDSDILAEVLGELSDGDENEDESELEDLGDEPPTCPASADVDKAVEVLQQLSLFCGNGEEMRKMLEKFNVHAQKELSSREKQSHITDFFQKQ